MKIGNRDFDTANKTYIMGILNVTPDSFSDGGRFNRPDAALFHAEEMIREGADIIDVGGESTRPGHTAVSEEEEISRVVPVIEKITSRFDIPVSVDTYKSEVAKQAIGAGACLVNDIWGLKADKKMAGLIAEKNVSCCLMHNRKEAVYEDFLPDMKRDLEDSIGIARAAGISDDKIMLDPGIGFGKTYELNLQAMNHLQELHQLGYPLLLAASRKSVIGLTLELPADERAEGTMATTALGVMKGCGFVRVHDIRQNKRVIQMMEAILKSGKPQSRDTAGACIR
ncbi:MAG: dihydropteroate synthase [Firmicutes bacterium]|nr:dihydropteroate synthase [Bacillota bacterium]